MDTTVGKALHPVAYFKAPDGKTEGALIQTCCARTKYLSEIYKNQTIIVGTLYYLWCCKAIFSQSVLDLISLMSQPYPYIFLHYSVKKM